MILARVLSKIYKEDGIILVDPKGQKYICGNPRSEKPITLKILKESLGTKLILFPEIAFPEAYMNEELIIENASLRDFILGFVKNLGRTEVTTLSLISKKIYGIWRTLTNFNLQGKSKKNVEHHYDVGGNKGEKLYDLFLDKNLRQYSMAMWFDDTKTLEEAQKNKVDHIIKKLDIKPGMRVLDVGCGWGGLAFEMAKQKGCEVLGITLSDNQLDYCKTKAKELN